MKHGRGPFGEVKLSSDGRRGPDRHMRVWSRERDSHPPAPSSRLLSRTTVFPALWK